MGLSLTDEEKIRVRRHLGYLNVTAVSTFSLGVPAAMQTQFIIEGAMNRLLPEAYDEARRLLTILDGVEQQIVEDQELLAVSKVDEIDIRPDEFKQLVKQYLWWQASLANMFGVPPNPFDQRFSPYGGGGMGINVNVQH
jgi:hypothetical protein